MKRYVNENPFSRLFDTISACMKPVIPILMAAGILKLLIILIGYTGLFTRSPQTEDVLSAVSNAAFYFLPVFTAYSSACHFRVNPPYCHGICGGSSAARFYRAFKHAGNDPFSLSPCIQGFVCIFRIACYPFGIRDVKTDRASGKSFSQNIPDIFYAGYHYYFDICNWNSVRGAALYGHGK